MMNRSAPNHPITLAEELVLLAIEDDGRIASAAGGPGFGVAVNCAWMLELSMAGRIDGDLNRLRILSTDALGSPAADRILAELSKGPGKTIEGWLLSLQRIAKETVRLTLDALIERGILKKKDQNFLWVKLGRRYPVLDGREQVEARLRIRQTLDRNDLPSPRDSIMLGLARAAFLLEGFLSAAQIKALDARMSDVAGLDLFVRAAEAAIHFETENRPFSYSRNY
jgi:hypothetical protein